jgi:hypothetical protein
VPVISTLKLMAFRPLLSRPSHAAVLSGAAIFLLLYFGLLGYLQFAMRSDKGGKSDVGLIAHPMFGMTWGFLQYVLPGFITGYLAKRSPLMHGAILGAIAAIFMYAYSQLAYEGEPLAVELSDVAYWVYVGALWCAVGAVIGDYVASTVHKL